MERILNTRTVLAITELGSGSKGPAQLPFRPSKPFHIVDSEIVGFNADKDKIISQLLDGNILRRMVLSIVGVGGLGKTTLAQKVYRSAELKAKFPYQAWLSISQKYDVNNLRRELLYVLEPRMKDQNPSDEEVWEKLVNFLTRKRYLIILDDVWTVDLWDQLKIVIPDTKNASRVIITTRNRDVALAADRKTEPHNLRYLNEDESLTLLFRKAQQDVQPNNKYPSHLVDVAKSLIEKCGNLPLALVVLGGRLSTETDSCIAWTRVYNTLDWHNDQENQCMAVLRMSYQELSYRLKQCFMYFAAFPEDHRISPKQVTRMWIAERLIPVDGKGTLEDRADDYLEDLIKRSLVQVVEKSWDDSIEYCGMHDLLRDLAIHEAKEANFFSILSKPEDCMQLAAVATHRVALQFSKSAGYELQSKNIRSLLDFGGSVPNYQGCTQLRVLAIDFNCRNFEIGKNWLQGLVHIRYLGLSRCIIKSWEVLYNIHFKSMKNLETLCCIPVILTVGISSWSSWSSWSLWEVPTLRNIIFDSINPVSGPLKWDHLKNLHTLEWMMVDSIPKLESNLNLRTLKIQLQLRDPEDNWKALQALLSRTEHLVSLGINLENRILFPADGFRELPCYETIQYLSIHGRWAEECIPSIEMFPKYLTVLELQGSDFENIDPMCILERLPCLTILQLTQVFTRVDKMICSREGFPNLEKLILYNIDISELEIKEGSMPALRQLTLELCTQLSALPDVQNVPSLQELIVTRHSVKLDQRLQSEENLYKIKHIPSVRISDPFLDSDDDDEGEYDKDDNDSGDDNVDDA